MPGTLTTHQTSDDMLASASESLSGVHPVGSRISSGSGSASEQHHLTAASFDDAMSADAIGSGGHHIAAGHVAPTNTVRMGKMLESQPRTRTTAHHHASSGR